MSAVCGRRGRPLIVFAWVLLAAVTIGSAAAFADTVNVIVDKAKVMRLPAGVATIVIGNPLIADASLQRGGVLVLTGKSFGSTNLLALDRDGRIILDKTVRVQGQSNADLVTVYRGVNRESYSCAPKCEPRITLGDSPSFFGATMAESASRSGAVQRAGTGGGPQH
ncbi:MAG TPA: pilus assembly protein N-terminal domain-containing protein [Pseudolabrys sp.]|nr:pilus assembly protein N-terminal domain-containing protein [Pseudolabrys sp.]